MLEIYNGTLPPTDIHFAICYSNIGLVYVNISDYLKAVLYYGKALEIGNQ